MIDFVSDAMRWIVLDMMLCYCGAGVLLIASAVQDHDASFESRYLWGALGVMSLAIGATMTCLAWSILW